ncbi:MAG TPA: DUF1343 domain-containing protein [Chitinophagaceae bacterium]|nr:DUF1343 domain-containing protein [Chitinophagaceae bacterium]
MTVEKTLFGIDEFLKHSSEYKNKRIGLVTNNAATSSYGELTRLALDKKGFRIIKLFSPEHGLDVRGADGSFQDNTTDKLTGIPVISLYGENLAPSENDLSGIDIVLFDVPDVGSRFYTYLWTMTHVLEACSTLNKPLIILDRPNPIGGNLLLAEGPMLDEENCSSFIGRWNIPIRHSCTLGELAGYFIKTKKIIVDLTIVKIENWNRHETKKDISWNFTATSPAIRDIETALLYPGMGLMEGINVNEGRGTDFPFKIIGAPWINAELLVHQFQSLALPGINSNEYVYTAADSVYKNECCRGIKLTIEDASVLKPVLTGLELIRLLIKLFPENCKEKKYPTRANPAGENHLDKLTGVFHSFKKIKSGEIMNEYKKGNNWKEKITPFLLY